MTGKRRPLNPGLRQRSNPGPVVAIKPGDVLLSSKVSVARYRELEAAQSTGAIVTFLRERFEERYLTPLLDADTDVRNGFAMMAGGCLMIEALESFRLGWPDSRGRSEKAFCSFFAHWPPFEVLCPHAEGFYTHVRCGILHQAETTGGWRIRRKGALFDETERTVNATRFLKNLRAVLGAYCGELALQPWDSAIWRAFRAKMNHLCKNALG